MSRLTNSNSRLSTDSYRQHNSRSSNHDQVNSSHSQLTNKNSGQSRYSVSIHQPRQQTNSSREAFNKNSQQKIYSNSRISDQQYSARNVPYVKYDTEHKQSSFSKKPFSKQALESNSRIANKETYPNRGSEKYNQYINQDKPIVQQGFTQHIYSQPQYINSKHTITYGNQVISEPQYKNNRNRNIQQSEYRNLSRYYEDQQKSKYSGDYRDNSRLQYGYRQSQTFKNEQSNRNNYYKEDALNFNERETHRLKQREINNFSFNLNEGLKITSQTFSSQYLDRGLQLLFQKYGLKREHSNDRVEIDFKGMQRILNDMYANLNLNIKVTPQEVQDYIKRVQNYNCRLINGKISKPQMKKVVQHTHIYKTEIQFLDEATLRILQNNATGQFRTYKSASSFNY